METPFSSIYIYMHAPPTLPASSAYTPSFIYPSKNARPVNQVTQLCGQRSRLDQVVWFFVARIYNG